MLQKEYTVNIALIMAVIRHFMCFLKIEFDKFLKLGVLFFIFQIRADRLHEKTITWTRWTDRM